jgi:hypothetical protein
MPRSEADGFSDDGGVGFQAVGPEAIGQHGSTSSIGATVALIQQAGTGIGGGVTPDLRTFVLDGKAPLPEPAVENPH